jgi:DNA-binding NarL/FixJ family response regulator
MTIHYDYRSFVLAAIAGVAAVVLDAPVWHAAIGAALVIAFGLVAATLIAPRAVPIAPTSPNVVPQVPPRHGAVHPLTPTQTKVAALVARGLTNREIADSLVVDERTVDNHVQAIFTRLDFHRRSQVAVWAVEHGLYKPEVSTQK